jgi:hypothetical protein
MADSHEFSCKINLVHGDPITFKVEATEERRRNVATRLEKAMQSNYLGVKLPDRLIIVPTHNVQSIEIMPPPPSMMLNVVNDAIPINAA